MNRQATHKVPVATGLDTATRAAIDWMRMAADLDAQGCAVIEHLLTHDECVASPRSTSATSSFAAEWS
jgi:hypothetical protein